MSPYYSGNTLAYRQQSIADAASAMCVAIWLPADLGFQLNRTNPRGSTRPRAWPGKTSSPKRRSRKSLATIGALTASARVAAACLNRLIGRGFDAVWIGLTI